MLNFYLVKMRVFLCCLFVVYFFGFTYAINDSCTTDDDCTVKEKSVCINNTCQCDTISSYSEARAKCLNYVTEYGALCYEEWQCEDFIGNNSKCLNNACLCQTGYRWFQGKCQKYANKGEFCNNTDIVCLDLNNPLALNCSNNMCQCSDGYYDRGEDCRLKSELNKECAITSDCFPTTNTLGILIYSHCELGKCVTNVNEKPLQAPDRSKFNNTFRYITPSSRVKSLLDEESLSDATPSESNDTRCLNGVKANLFETACQECPNTIFFRNSCICDRGFFLQEGQCIAEVSMEDPHIQYVNASACPIKPGKVVNGTCYCRDYWFQDSTNRECKKTTLQYTQNCLDNDWCKAMGPHAYCDSETNKCQCSSLAVLNETTFYCELKPDANLTEICSDDSSCPLYETCTDEKCQCDEGFFRVNETSLCMPKIGYSCEVRDCEHIDDAVCSNNETCQCKSNDYVTDGFQCLKEVMELYAECEISQQCTSIPHSDCLTAATSENATTKCMCASEFLDVDGICYAVKTPGSQCSTEFNCTVILGNTFECRNGLCQCPIGKILSADNICVASSAKRLFAAVLPVLITVLAFLKCSFE